MKRKHLVISLLLLAISMISCGSGDQINVKEDIIGSWKGTLYSEGEKWTFYYEFFEDGTLIRSMSVGDLSPVSVSLNYDFLDEDTIRWLSDGPETDTSLRNIHMPDENTLILTFPDEGEEEVLRRVNELE
jgi:hypothetical protein